MYWLHIVSLFKKLCMSFLQLTTRFSYVTPLSSIIQDYVTLVMIWNIKFENGYNSPG